MRIEKIAGAASNMGERARPAAPDADAPSVSPNGKDNAAKGAESRTLVALEPRRASPRGPHARHSAPFLAQLLANRIGVPQTRARRRALPEDGSAHYAATGNLSCAPRIGITDRRSI